MTFFNDLKCYCNYRGPWSYYGHIICRYLRRAIFKKVGFGWVYRNYHIHFIIICILYNISHVIFIHYYISKM